MGLISRVSSRTYRTGESVKNSQSKNTKKSPQLTMASRIHFANNSEIGCFVNLTNTYCLVAIEDSNNFASIFENDLGGSDEFRICRTRSHRGNLQIERYVHAKRSTDRLYTIMHFSDTLHVFAIAYNVLQNKFCYCLTCES